MATNSWVYWVSFIVCLLAFLAFSMAIWKHFKSIPHSKIRVIDFVLSIFFTMIAVFVSADLFYVAKRFDAYVMQAAPRDDEQERCEKDILHVLRIWATARQELDTAQQAREVALLPFYREYSNGHGQPDPTTAQNIILRTEELEDARTKQQSVLENNPIPDCKLRINNNG